MDLEASADAITVVPLGADKTPWRNFLARSVNATLFHDLDFLRYHPEGRFHFHHVMVMRGGKPVALFPGALDVANEHPLWCSTLGASVGGLAVDADLRAGQALDIVQALQDYTRQQAWSGIQVTVPPGFYSRDTADVIAFAMFSRGFRLEHRWLCPTLELGGGPGAFERHFSSRQISYVRAARRKGMRGIETGIEGLSDFLVPFRDTYARHDVPATHSEDEIRDLLTRFPDRVRIHLAMLDEEAVAALLIFHVTKAVAFTFYICRTADYPADHGAAVVIADAIDRLGAAGLRYLDFGPSASDMKFNRGNTFFKEGLGAVGYCRDRWHWCA